MFSTDQEDYLIQENRKLKNKIKQLERLILNKYINYTINKYYINDTKNN